MPDYGLNSSGVPRNIQGSEIYDTHGTKRTTKDLDAKITEDYSLGKKIAGSEYMIKAPGDYLVSAQDEEGYSTMFNQSQFAGVKELKPYIDQVNNDPSVIKVDTKYPQVKLPKAGTAHIDINENKHTNTYRNYSDVLDRTTEHYGVGDHIDTNIGNIQDRSTRMGSSAVDGYHGAVDGSMYDADDGEQWAYDSTKAVIHPQVLSDASYLLTQYAKAQGLSEEEAKQFGDYAAITELSSMPDSIYTAAGIQMRDAIKKICLDYNLDDGHLAEYRKEQADDNKAAKAAKSFNGDIHSEAFANHLKLQGVPESAINRLIQKINLENFDARTAEWMDANEGSKVTNKFRASYTVNKSGVDAVKDSTQHLIDEELGNMLKSTPFEPVDGKYYTEFRKDINDYKNFMDKVLNDPNYKPVAAWSKGIGDNIEVMAKLLDQSDSPALKDFPKGTKERTSLAHLKANIYMQKFGDTVLALDGSGNPDAIKGFAKGYMQEFGISEADLNNADITIKSTTNKNKLFSEKRLKGAEAIIGGIESYSTGSVYSGYVYNNPVENSSAHVQKRMYANLQAANAKLGDNPSPRLKAMCEEASRKAMASVGEKYSNVRPE